MQRVEAFKSLGYEVGNPRNDWSAEKADGICITIWKEELIRQKSKLYLDFWERPPSGEGWQGKSGERTRSRHIARAVREFGGRVDVIFLTGAIGKKVQSADPWYPEERSGAHWLITKFDPQNGYFRAEINTQMMSQDS